MRPVLLLSALLIAACDEGTITESRPPATVEYGRDISRCAGEPSAVFALEPFTVWTAYKCDAQGGCLSVPGLWDTTNDTLTVSCTNADRVVLVWQVPST